MSESHVDVRGHERIERLGASICDNCSLVRDARHSRKSWEFERAIRRELDYHE